MRRTNHGSIFHPGVLRASRPGDERPAQAPCAAAPRPAAQPYAAQARATQGAGLNQAIAGCLLLDNQEEIALAQFAESRAQNEKVKEFAKTMIEQHQQAVAKLAPLAPDLAAAAATVVRSTPRPAAMTRRGPVKTQDRR